MRIAYCVINHNKTEGTSKAISEVAERLAHKHEVHVFARSARGVDLTKVSWHRIRGPSFPHLAEFLGYVWPCAWMLQPSAFDIVHAAGSIFTQADVYTIQNIQPAKRRVLQSFAAQESAGIARRLTRAAYLKVTSLWERRCYEGSARPRTFLPVSQGVGRELQEFYAIGRSSIQVIPNGADLERFQPLSPIERSAQRSKFGFGASDFLCAFSGGEWRRKGLDLAICALGRIEDTAVKLLVLGRDDSEPEFRKFAQDCGVADRVHFAGFQAAVEKGLACADVFLFPSRYEAFSLATLEAAACALPLVTTKINGTEDFIEPGVTGVFVEPESIAIAQALEQLRAQPAEELQAMGAAARRRVERDYTWDRVAAMTEAVYERILEQRH